MPFVIDNSVVVAWFIPSQATVYTERALERARRDALHAPAIWPLELTNVLLVLERRRKLTAAEAAEILARAERLAVVVDRSVVSMGKVRSLARRYGLSAYDASYLELAERIDLPLAARNGSLYEAAKLAGRLLKL